MTTSNDRLDRLFAMLAEIDAEYYRRSFFLLWLGYVLAVLYRAIDYRPAARLFPILVGILLVVLLVGTLLASLSGRTVDIAGPLGGVFEAIETYEQESDLDDATRYRREAAALVWLVVLFASIWLFGYLLATVVYVPAFVYVHERNARRAVLTGVGTAVFLYILFVELLSASIYDGVLAGLI
ncbi:MAG: tripartite tricarboxylate transporter TctB family protein [Natronomonas sp.]